MINEHTILQFCNFYYYSLYIHKFGLYNITTFLVHKIYLLYILQKESLIKNVSVHVEYIYTH